MLEGDNHEHHIVEISQDDDGKLSMRKFGSFTRVTDSFCFETEDLKSFCYIVTTGDSGEEEEKPICKHGISTTTAVIQRQDKCPHEDGALSSYVLCESKLLDFQKENKGNIRILDSNTKHFHKLNRESKYKMEIQPGGTIAFKFLDLCKSNGEHYLGHYPRNIQAKNCKNSFSVSLTLLELDDNEWDQKMSVIEPIEPCQHLEECKLLTHDSIAGTTLADSKHDGFSDSEDSNTSSHPPTTVVNIRGNVKTLGSIAGKNIKNDIKDQSMGDSTTRKQKHTKNKKRGATQKK